jgi:two-component system LytT family response regulator
MTPPAIRALIVDDEPLARARLRTLLSRHPDMQVVAECAEGAEAIGAIARSRPEVVFLDIEMTDPSGMDVAAGLGGAPLPAVVFVTAHERYALEAFDVRALDYLL